MHSPIHRAFLRALLPLAVTLVILLPPRTGFAWGEPHLAITQAAIEVLPSWQRDLLGDELDRLGDSYCLIPDEVYTNRANARYAMMDSQPGVTYLLRLHLPSPQQAENLETLRYFIDRAVAALKDRRPGDAARFMGTICHLLEDFGSPSHTIPGDNMFTLLQQFLPPSEGMKDKLLHSPIENGKLEVHIAGYQPRLLGMTVDEVAWRLLHREHEGIINARSTTFPIIQALNADDPAGVSAGQMKAAKVDAEIVADALHSILCLGAAKFEDAERAALRSVPIAALYPVEAVNLFYPQTHFFSSPYWGHARSGDILAEGKKAVPLTLRVREGNETVVKEFSHGISSGVGKPLTFLIPRGVYGRFTVHVGLHPELGAEGRVEFSVFGDGKPLATATLNGAEAVQTFECDIAGVWEIQLAATGRGADRTKNYAIWAEPTLWRAGE